MPEIFIGGEFRVDALGLENDADVAAKCFGLANRVQASDHGTAGSRHHERGKNAEQSCLAAAVRAKETEEFGRADVERDAVERDAILVAMHQVANGNDGLGSRIRQPGREREDRSQMSSESQVILRREQGNHHPRPIGPSDDRVIEKSSQVR